MTKEWAKEYMETLKKRMEKYTDTNQMVTNPENPDIIFLQNYFSVYQDHSIYVMMQAMVFELKPDVPQVEIIVTLTNDVKKESIEELQKAIEELNYVSPVGIFGIRRNRDCLYLRNCWILDSKKNMEELVKDTEIFYEMMLEGVQGAYRGLSKIWTGEMTFDETVEKNLLRKSEM